MEFIVHRVNTIEQLKEVPEQYGVEVDIRDCGERLILQHDPFKDGEDFEEYIKHYNHGTIILNIKSEGIEFRILELLKKHKINKYFFLDSSFPMIHLLSNQNEQNIALRFSEFEGVDTILNMKGKVNWVWVDCFTKLPMDRKYFELLTNFGFKICLVSPDLVGRAEDIDKYKDFICEQRILFDAVCTKIHNINKWTIIRNN